MLNNTSYLLNNEKKLTVGYFGGSITEGGGEDGYRSRVNSWLRQSYPDAEITEIQAAIGGTGTDLGIYRCERDLISKKPDLVFFEFAVNDSGRAYDTVAENTETIFRKLLRANPYTDIVVIFTVEEAIHQRMAEGGEYVSRAAQSAVAHYYKIPSVDVGEVLRVQTLIDGADFQRYTHDGVHPNPAGYTIYTDIIVKWLTENLHDCGAMEAHRIPTPFTNVHENARLTDFHDVPDFKTDGFTFVGDKTMCGRYPHYIEATEVGACISFSFVGEGLGFYLMLANDSGDLSVKIDDNAPITVRSWDKYCKYGSRAGGVVFAKGLDYGTHRVEASVIADKAEESEGNAVRIGALMIH